MLDLPDLDSVERAHRRTVDGLLPRVDLVVWVLDPQKYNDLQVHGPVRGRRRWAAQLVFVLNQADRLASPIATLWADLVASLRDDGIAARSCWRRRRPPVGPPGGSTRCGRSSATAPGARPRYWASSPRTCRSWRGGSTPTRRATHGPRGPGRALVGARRRGGRRGRVGVVNDVAVARTARAGAGPPPRPARTRRAAVARAPVTIPAGRALGAPQEQARDAPGRPRPLGAAAHALNRGLLDLASSDGGAGSACARSSAASTPNRPCGARSAPPPTR